MNVELLRTFRHLPASYLMKRAFAILRKEGIKGLAGRALTVRHTVLAKGHYTLVTYEEMIKWTLDWCRELPRDVDVIVGIPRSGMLVASIVALRMAKPLSTPDEILDGKYYLSSLIEDKAEKPRRLLLIDDSICNGVTSAPIKEALRAKGFEIVTACLLVHDFTDTSLADYYYKVVPGKACFEWALAHQKGVGILRIATDMDGVLCEDCPVSIDLPDKEQEYIEWMKNARPNLIPAYEFEAIVSNRLSKYESYTREWLKKNNVKYKALYLWDISDKKDRLDWTSHKIKVLNKIRPDLYFENATAQAEAINKHTHIDVLVVPESRVIKEGK